MEDGRDGGEKDEVSLRGRGEHLEVATQTPAQAHLSPAGRLVSPQLP